MKRIIGLILLSGIIFTACNSETKDKDNKMNTNVLLEKFDTPFEVPPFDQIKQSDYVPAYKEAIKQHDAEIEAIVNNTEAPTFENTIEALELSGQLLNRIDNIFNNLTSTNSDSVMQAIAKEVSPLMSAHSDDIYLNDKLFARIKKVYEQKDNLKLDTEQAMLLDKTYKAFVRGGANLSAEDKETLRGLNKELGILSLEFGENVLAETNAFEMLLTDEADLAGLPDGVKQAAAANAKDHGHESGWLFTLDKPSLIPFITYSDKRDLREKMFKGYIMRGDNNNANDNKEVVKKMVNLRLKKANLLGFKNHASFVLDNNMAKNPDNVFELLGKVMPKANEMAKKELIELQKLADSEGANIKIEAWDWWYYSEKVRKAKYDLDEEQLRPYFKLENVRNAVFEVSGKLYGLKFVRNKDIPVYHKDAEAYEVHNADGSLQAILYMDFYPRASKRAGAWMTSFRKQHYKDGKNIIPIISVVTNFTKPTADKPSLLNYDEVSTLFHEFGHALHGMLSDCKYNSLSGTAVPRDFVEMPSQIMENWASEPEVMKAYFKHYKTGEPIPDELIAKIQKSGKFNAGFAISEYTAAAYLDMAWHTITEPFTGDVNAFETEQMKKIGLIDEIVVRYRSTYFSHIFAGGYSAGYYAYMWAEVIDADAFQAFKEAGIFDKKTAQSFRDNILSRGGTEDAMELYKKFRGREPKIDAYLERKGLN
ncbi:MAG: peptidase M3 [Bacteroidetes bacterium]|nr:MAG: peptidase M3 [Bacteroidota bacterium]